MFNILIEEKILFGCEAFENLGHITICKGNRLTAADLKYVDVLLIRSGTRVEPELIEGSPVRFIGTATAGTDHVNIPYLENKGIPFFNAPACNAESVVEYILSALFTLVERKSESLVGKKLGIVGAGNVGGRLARRLPGLGLDVLVYDPFLYPNEKPADDLPFTVTSFDELVEESDIVTIHTPLTRSGSHPTFHMFDESVLRRLKPNAWLLNAARGAVIDNEALLQVMNLGHLGAVVLDVFENEPAVNHELLEKADLATPHIAGHSFEGKVNGTIQIYESMTGHFNVDGGWNPEEVLKASPEDLLEHSWSAEKDTEAGLRELLKEMYDIEADDATFRASLSKPAEEHGPYFLKLRKEYPRRRSFERHQVNAADASDDVKWILTEVLRVKI